MSDSKAVQERLQLAASVLRHAREGILITTLDAEVIDVNPAFTEITGYSREEIVGQTPRVLGSGKHDAAFFAEMWRQLSAEGCWSGEIWNRRKSGEMYVQMLTISVVRDLQGRPFRYLGLFLDISQQKEHELRLERVAHYDPLTGLPNRALLADRLRQAMVNAHRRNQKLALVFIDLDGFKAINDSHGHAAGDRLLVALAGRMTHGLRSGDTLARLGGDEFVAVLIDLKDDDAATPVVERVRAAAAQPVSIDGVVMQVTASLGMTFYPQVDDIDADQLVRQADQTMYQAKLKGKNRILVFNTEQNRNIHGHHEAWEAIRRAIGNGEFELHYQPKVNMRTGQMVGVEALIRWRHPERGLLTPAAFMPALSGHALGIELGEWTLAAAMAQIQTWKAAGLKIPVSVNITAQQIQRLDFVARLRAQLAEHADVGAGDLELEVLETSSVEDIPRVSEVMQACRDMGVGFALDDFGTGYSSLTYLRRLPTSLLKIDRSVVHDMLDNPEDLTILHGVIGLAAAFGKEVLAEGVETLAHGQILLHLGCERAQGYAIARPMAADAIPHWLATWRPDPSWLNLALVSRDDLPAIFAMVEHRAWVVEIMAHLRGDRDAPPALDPHHCRFGQWLDHQSARSPHGKQWNLDAIDRLHREIHDRAHALVALKQCGQTAAALAGCTEIQGLRDRLLGQLTKML
ncbi:MAG: EAL domain-containing protein [Rubrivivax sp.]|nr:EAL domain-containing protein [Rubrivivax sp.]